MFEFKSTIWGILHQKKETRPVKIKDSAQRLDFALKFNNILGRFDKMAEKWCVLWVQKQIFKKEV
jgi:hypothetical protein